MAESRYAVLEERTKQDRCAGCGREIEVQVLVTSWAELATGDRCKDCLEEAEAIERQREVERRWRQNVRESGLPATFRRATFEGFAQPNPVEAAERWACGELRGLCLCGPVGVGKSWLAAAALKRRARDVRVRWVDVAQLMTGMRSSYADEARREAVGMLLGRSAVVLDDLDKVNPSEYGREVVFSAINARVAAGSQLLITTNRTPSELGDRLGEAIASRIAGYCEVYELQGSDRRLAA